MKKIQGRNTFFPCFFIAIRVFPQNGFAVSIIRPSNNLIPIVFHNVSSANINEGENWGDG